MALLKFAIFDKTSWFCTCFGTSSAKVFHNGLCACLHLLMTALARQKHDVLGVLNFLLLPSRIFFCFPVDSAALSDSWHALILIIALHQYFSLSLLFFLVSFCACVFLWCDGYLSASTMDVHQQETSHKSVRLDTTGIFSQFACYKANLLLACLEELLLCLAETPHPPTRCWMWWEGVWEAPLSVWDRLAGTHSVEGLQFTHWLLDLVLVTPCSKLSPAL